MAPQRMEQVKIDQAIRDAETHAEETVAAASSSTCGIMLTSLVTRRKKLLKEHGPGLEATRKSVEEKLEALRQVLTTMTFSTLRTAVDALNKEAQRIGVEMYGKAEPRRHPLPADGSSDPSIGRGRRRLRGCDKK